MTNDLEKRFHIAMVNICKRAYDECGYRPSQFLRMISEQGGLAAAKKLIRGRTATEGFETLWGCHRLDLSIEAHVLLPEFAPLFTDDERELCRNRLLDYGFNPDKQ